MAKRSSSLLIAFLAALVLASCSPPGLLDGLNSLWPGDSDAKRVARGIAYGSDRRQTLDVWAPKTPHDMPLPVVVFFYGGAWAKGSRGDYGFAGRAYAAQGFVTVVPDYRLVPTVRYPAFVEDSARAVKWTVDHIAAYGGDPHRITLAAHSAGAYNAAMLALDPHFLDDAGVARGTVRAAALLAGPYDFYPWDDQRAVDAFANWPRPEETQPIRWVSKDAPPLWLGYGTADDVVKPRNSIRLAAALRRVGGTVELRAYPGKSHIDLVKGLSKPFRGAAPTLAESTAFLKEHSR